MDWFKQLFSNKKRIFLDYASATPLRKEARASVEKYWSRDFYNPNAIYAEGEKVRKEIRECKERIAKLFDAQAENVVFTSGGTEGNVWIMQGIKNVHVVIDNDSHPSVLDAAKGLKVSIWNKDEELPVRKETTLVSSITTDNKLGRKVRELRKKNGGAFPFLHIDASQSAQYFNVGLETLACDILTLDSAKLYGPKGIGAIIFRRGVKIDLPPQGTPSVPLIAGFTKALELAVKDREVESKRLSSLAGKFVAQVQKGIPNALVEVVEPNMVNVTVPGILPEFLVLKLDRKGVMVSAGPACNSNKPEPPETPVRFSFGKFTTEDEIKKAAEILCLEAKM